MFVSRKLTFFIVMRIHMGLQSTRPIRKKKLNFSLAPSPSFWLLQKKKEKEQKGIPWKLLPADLTTVHL